MGQYDPNPDLPPLSNPTTTQRPAYGQAGLAPQSSVDSDSDSDTGSLGGSSGSSSPRTGDPLHRVVQGAHQTIDKLAQRAAPTVQRMQDGAERARETGDEWIENLRSTVREKPIASLATALMFGMVVARLMR